MKILAKKRLLAKKRKPTLKVDINGYGAKTASYLYRLVQKTNAELDKQPLITSISELRKEFRNL